MQRNLTQIGEKTGPSKSRAHGCTRPWLCSPMAVTAHGCTLPTALMSPSDVGKMMSFTNQHRIDKSRMWATLVPRDNDYDYDKVTVTFPSQLRSYGMPRQTGVALRALIEFCINNIPTMYNQMEVVRPVMDTLTINIDSPPSLLQLLSNRTATARSVQATDRQQPPQCSCRTGQFAAFVDVNVGHVLTTDMTILRPILGIHAESHVGLNFRVEVPQVRSNVLVSHVSESLQTAILEIAAAAGLPEDEVRSDMEAEYTTIARKVVVTIKWLQTQARTCHKSIRVTLDEDSDAYIQVLKTHLLLTCLDKASSTCVAMCKPFAKHLIASRLFEGPYIVTDNTVLRDMAMTELEEFLLTIGVNPQMTQGLPYMYPILKAHKCLSHSALVLHDCKFEYRFIQSGQGAFSTWLSKLNAAMLKTTMIRVEDQRDSEAKSFYAKHGYKLRFRFSIDSWQTLALNLPHRVPNRYTIIVGDIQDAFPSLPLEGPDSVFIQVDKHVREAFQGKEYLAIPLDKHDQIKGRARFTQSIDMRSLSYGKVIRHLVLTVDEVIRCIHMSLHLDLVGSDHITAYPTKGIPIGGSASSQILDLTADQWEVSCARRIARLADSTVQRDRALARKLALMLKWYCRYADDMFALAEPEFIGLLWNEHMPGADRQSPLWIYPLMDSGGEKVLGIKASDPAMDEGRIRSEYLCLAIILSEPGVNGYRSVSYEPYNKRYGFQFVFPMFTLWKSAAPRSVKEAILKSMLQYAVIGATTLEGATQFLQIVISRLVLNGYPQRVLVKLWRDLKTKYLYSIPCRACLHVKLDQLAYDIEYFIRRVAYRQHRSQ